MQESSLGNAAELPSASNRWTQASVVGRISLILSLSFVATAQLSFADRLGWHTGWWLAGAAIAAAAVWQYRLPITDWRSPAGRLWGFTTQTWRRAAGASLSLTGAWLWFDASRHLSANWNAGFDRAWLSWLAAAVLMSAGFRLLQVSLPGKRNRLARWEWVALLVAFSVAAVWRLANFENYPPNDGVSQVEELQTGAFAQDFLDGGRSRWEFLGQMWVGVLGVWFGGHSLRAVRMAFAIVSLLKIVPAYFLFRALAGPAGAAAGTALLAVSGWDAIVNRIPGHQDGLVITCCMALVTGPLVRGAWAAIPWVGLLAGYTIYTYIACRPLLPIALLGVVIACLARRPEGRFMPRVRDLLPAALLIVLLMGMFVPLTHRLDHGRFFPEYFNGLNRARAVGDYYVPTDTWSQALDRRWQRAAQAASLFFTVGDTNPTHNVDGRPMADPVTGGLLILGLGYAALACLRGFYGLMLAALGVVFLGTLVVTGNFDVLRAGAMIPYFYAIVAIGAGAVHAAAVRSFRRSGQVVATIVLALGVLWASYSNGKLLMDLWSSPVTHRHYRNDLAYLSDWLRNNAGGSRVIGLIPSGAGVVFLRNDASWLRGPNVSGESAWDTNQVLRLLGSERSEVILLVAVPSTMDDLIDYFEYVLPGLHLQSRRDEVIGDIRMAYGRVTAPAQLVASQDFRRRLCSGVHAYFDLLRENGTVIGNFSEVVPFVDHTTWPGALRTMVFNRDREAHSIKASWEGTFEIGRDHAGAYHFLIETNQGNVTATIDDKPIIVGSQVPITLVAGSHRFTMQGRFRALVMEPMARLWWRGPATGEETRLVPFYRLADADRQCQMAPG